MFTVSSYALKKYLVIGAVTSSLVLGTLIATPHAHAATSTADLASLIELLTKQLRALQAQLKNGSTETTSGTPVRGNAPEHMYTQTDDGKTGRPAITLTSPAQRSVFDKEEDAIDIAWEAKNIPDDSVIEVELDTVRLTGGGSGVGGGMWQGEIPSGDSDGSYDWEIQGEGRADVGTYRVRVSVRACHSEGCDVNPRFPGHKERIKTYAKSAWRTVTVVDESRVPAEETASYRAILNGRTVDSTKYDITEEEAEARCKVIYNDYDRFSFKPGDVLKCYWGKDRFMTVDGWKG